MGEGVGIRSFLGIRINCAALILAAVLGILSAGVARAADGSQPETFVVYFDYASAKLSSVARPIITDAVAAIKAHKERGNYSHIKVIGYADSAGTTEGADRLSVRRAEAVRAELIRDGLDPDEIKTEGRGKHEPEVDTADQVRQPRNRRVRIVIYRPGD